LLPGTGSAAFELIRGLYDDQNEGRNNPPPLRYRGIPAYPSEAAFRLFKSFFSPHAPPGQDALALFMDPAKAHQVQWLPSANPPQRYFDCSTGAALTVQGLELEKLTLADDPTGLPYMNPKRRAFPPCDRSVHVIDKRIVLIDRDRETVLGTALPAPVAGDVSPSSPPLSPVDWRSVFVGGIPHIAPDQAYGAVLLYPEDDASISELAAQPFVADYLEDLAEQDREIGRLLAQANQVLIQNGDAVIATCIAFDRPRDYTVVLREAAFAQKQAQQLWTTCAQLGRWEWLKRIRFIQTDRESSHFDAQGIDVAYCWMPLGGQASLVAAVTELRRALRAGGGAFVTGPASLNECWKGSGFGVVWQDRVEHLPTFRMHRTILPNARLKDDLTLYFVRAL